MRCMRIFDRLRPRREAARPRRWPVLATLLVVVGCGNGGDDEPTPQPTTRTPTTSASPTSSLTPVFPPTPVPGPVEPTAIEELATDLDVPWGLAFLPDGSALISGRDDASIVRVTAEGEVTEVGTVPGVQHGGEGGLLGLAVAPDSAATGPVTVYAFLTTADDNRIVRMSYDGAALSEPTVVFDGLPAAERHNGGRIAFGPDGMLYVGAGDAAQPENAQDLDYLGGKILRIAPDGSIPADNPFDGSPVYSYGHRNVQGLAFDDTGRLWASEFGQDTWDELNLIAPGGNYGWQNVEGIGNDPDFTDPVAVWSTDDASPSGIAYVGDTIFMAALRGERLWQIPVPDGAAGEPQAFYDGEYGRLRHVALAPDGTLWALTNNTDGRVAPRKGDDRILRITVG